MDTPLPHLGLRSEYVINHLSSEFTDAGDVTVLRSPKDPGYYFGNLLALQVSLDSRTPLQWLERFRQLFSDLPEVEHCTLVWIREEPIPVNVSLFLQLGFDYEENHILHLQREQFREPDRLNADLVYRPLCSDDDWRQWTALNVAEQIDQHTEDELRPYLAGRIHNYRKLEQQALGETLGAFDEDRLIGYAGLYHLQELGRFQNVHVVPDYQNRQIARTLLTTLVQRLPDSVRELAAC